MKKTISACMIIKNEETNLANSLRSFIDYVDELIIVDTGSNDRTIEIAKRYTSYVFNMAWEDDFSLARNFSLEKASSDIILIIDADETVRNPEKLLGMRNNVQNNVGGWLIDLKTEVSDENGNATSYSNKLLRIFRNDTRFRFKGIIHEQILESILEAGFRLADSGLILEHADYNSSAEIMNHKQIRNLNLLNKAITNEPHNSYYLLQRAKSYEVLGKLSEAEQDIKAALSTLNSDSFMTARVCNYGAVLAYKLGKYDEAMRRADISLRIIPGQAFANFIKGEVHAHFRRHHEAYVHYRNMQNLKDNSNTSAYLAGELSIPNHNLHFKIGKALLGMKDNYNAAREFEKGLESAPNDINNLTGLANAEFNSANYSKAKTLLEKAIEMNPESSQLRKFLAQVDMQIQNTSEIESLDEVLESSYKTLVSLCMIVKNEERQLAACLNSARGFVDEIIIVDTGSTDKTVEIAKEFDAEIHHFPWQNDFSLARNESIKHAKGEWILYLDADERIDMNNFEKYRRLLQDVSSDIGGLICTIESDHAKLDGSTEKHRGGYPRIFRNYGYPNIKFQGRVHEQITPSIFALDKSLVSTDFIIEHLGYNQSREIMEKKVKRNYSMLIKHVQEEPENAYAWYQLGQTLGQMKLFAEAEKTIKFAIDLGSLSDSVYASATASLAQFSGNKKRFAEALDWSEKSLSKAPNQLYSNNLRAYSLMYLGRFEEAEAAFRLVTELKSQLRGVPKSGFDIEIPDSVISEGLNKLHELKEKARQ